jgi:putative ABC transport system substrate-binding protein
VLALIVSVWFVAATGWLADAYGQDKIRIVGQVFVGTEETSRKNLSLYREAFRELGYVEGKNLRLLVRYAEGRFDHATSIYEGLRSEGAEVLFAGTYKLMVAATQLESHTPVVMVSCGAEWFAETPRPRGRYFTGITCLSAELASKQFQLLRELVPNTTRVSVLYNPEYPSAELELRHLKAAAERLGVTVYGFRARAAQELEPRIAEIARSGTKAVLVISDGLFYAERQRVAALGIQHGLVIAASFRDYADAGAALSYGSNLKELIGRGVALADKILKGAKPADLPFEQPTRFDLIVNARTVKALKLAIPASLLAQADQVIE